MLERVSSVCLAVEYKFMPRYCSMYTCSKLSSIENGKSCDRRIQAAAMYAYSIERFFMHSVKAFLVMSYSQLSLHYNALLKLVKWNQITSSMDLVPFNQL